MCVIVFHFILETSPYRNRDDNKNVYRLQIETIQIIQISAVYLYVYERDNWDDTIDHFVSVWIWKKYWDNVDDNYVFYNRERFSRKLGCTRKRTISYDTLWQCCSTLFLMVISSQPPSSLFISSPTSLTLSFQYSTHAVFLNSHTALLLPLFFSHFRYHNIRHQNTFHN